VLIALAPFLAARQSVYDSGRPLLPAPGRIAAYVLGRPLWWALEQLGIVPEDDGAAAGGGTEWWGEYVVLALMEKAAEGVVERQGLKGGVEGLYTVEGFGREFAGVVGLGSAGALGEVDVRVLLRYLERDRGVVVTDYEVGLLLSLGRTNWTLC
jgi:charged multivesicular body protein 7